MGVSLRVLGPLQLWHDGVEVTPSARKERALLGMLGMNNGRVVAADRLVDEIWPDLPGSRGRHALHVRIAALRRLLAAAKPGARIDSVDPGYRLTMVGEDIDACRFEALVGEARHRSNDGDISGASLLLREALALWRGEALADVQLCSSLEAEAAQLEERRRNAHEDLVDAELTDGHHVELVNTLEAMVSEEPFRERRWALLMTALYRCGRQLDALRAFQRARAVLGDAGLEPGPQLLELERRIAAHDRTLDLLATSSPSPASEPALDAPRTLTFLFTDIEGSTSRWEVDSEAMRSALAVHDEVLRSAIEARGGWVFRHTGDGVCAAFGSPRAAIDAAVEAQRQLGLPVRMGVATGEVQERDRDYLGTVLNRTARVMAAGHGGQILVAASTASLVDGVELIDLGAHRLRGLSTATGLFQVRAEGVAVEFPPLRTLDATPHDPQAQATSLLVGRTGPRRRLADALRLAVRGSTRVVVVTGAAGIGKPP
jgi:DNA-binding SARP family transcriptional activator